MTQQSGTPGSAGASSDGHTHTTTAGPLPVLVLTGFLGSGKTTLLNHLLADEALRDTAVLINEFGAVGIDHLLVRSVDERVLLLDGGCVCCSVLGDLTGALLDLARKRDAGEVPPFARVLIETTGLADPAPLLRSLLANEDVSARYAAAGVVTVVDAEHAPGMFARHRESVAQVAVADRMVLSKCDLADESRVEAVLGLLRELNPAAPVFTARRGVTAAGERAVHLSTTVGALLEPCTPRTLARELRAVGPFRLARRAGPSPHGDTLRSRSVVLEGAVQWRSFVLWLSLLTQLHGEHILRVKALLRLRDESEPVVVHTVQHVIHPAESLPAWPDEDHRSRVVLITRGLDEAFLDEIEAGLRATAAPSKPPPPLGEGEA